MKVKMALCTLGLIALWAAASVSVAEEHREHEFAGDQVQHLTIENSVGEIVVRASEDDTIRVAVELEGNRSGIFRRKTDVSDMDISSREQGDRLLLSMDEDDVNARWVVYMPAMESLTLDLGVGNLRVENIEADISIDVGVGNAEVVSREDWLGDFDASVGVGGISVHGVSSYSSKRQVVAEQGQGKGTGSHALTIDVGVGDIDLNVE